MFIINMIAVIFTHFYLQLNSITSVISEWGMIPPFFFISYLSSALPSNFNVSVVKNLRSQSVFVFNVVLFSVLLIYIGICKLFIIFHVLWWYTQNNPECLLQNKIFHPTQIYHSILELIFQTYCLYFFPCIAYTEI